MKVNGIVYFSLYCLVPFIARLYIFVMFLNFLVVNCCLSLNLTVAWLQQMTSNSLGVAAFYENQIGTLLYMLKY